MSKIMELAEYYATLREDGVRRQLEDEAREALREKLASVEKDAARYRWLREQNEILEFGTWYVGIDSEDPVDIGWVGSDLDTAIDAAMEAAYELRPT